MFNTKDIYLNEDIFMYLTLYTYNSFKYLKTLQNGDGKLRYRMQSCTRNEAKWNRQIRKCFKLKDLNK